MIPNIILKKLISMNWPASLSIKKGVRIGETIVEQEVKIDGLPRSPSLQWSVSAHVLRVMAKGSKAYIVETVRRNPDRVESKEFGRSCEFDVEEGIYEVSVRAKNNAGLSAPNGFDVEVSKSGEEVKRPRPPVNFVMTEIDWDAIAFQCLYVRRGEHGVAKTIRLYVDDEMVEEKQLAMAQQEWAQFSVDMAAGYHMAWVVAVTDNGTESRLSDVVSYSPSDVSDVYRGTVAIATKV